MSGATIFSIIFWIGFGCFCLSEIQMYNFTKEVRGYKKTTVEYEQLNPTVPKEGKGNHVFMCGALTVLDPVRDEAFGVFTD